MDYKLRTIDTKLPVRVMKITRCDSCHVHYAIMRDVFIEGYMSAVFYSPLIDQGVDTRCGNCCRRAADMKAAAEQWLLKPDFFKSEFGNTPPDADELRERYLRGHWPAKDED